jgi:hypothetical protein
MPASGEKDAHPTSDIAINADATMRTRPARDWGMAIMAPASSVVLAVERRFD